MFGKLHSRDVKLIVLLAVIAAVALGASWYGGQKLERQILLHDATDEAVKWATYMEQNFGDIERTLTDGRLTPEDEAVINAARNAGGVFRYKMFDANGVIVVASRTNDLGQTNTKPYFSSIVRHGGTFTKLEEDEAFDGGRKVVSEAYVPFMRGSRFQGAIEVYVDNTARAAVLHGNIRATQWGFVGLLVLLGGASAAVMAYNIRERNRDYDNMAEANEALARADTEVRRLNEGLEQRAAQLDQKNAQVKEAYALITSLNKDLTTANSKLEGRVDERTADLERANEQLLRMTENFVGVDDPKSVAK